MVKKIKNSSKRFYFSYPVTLNKDELFKKIQEESKNINKQILICIISYYQNDTYVYCEFDKRTQVSNRYFMAFNFNGILYVPQFYFTQVKIKALNFFSNVAKIVFEYGLNVDKYLEARRKHKKFQNE